MPPNALQLLWDFREAFIGGIQVTALLLLISSIGGTSIGLLLVITSSLNGTRWLQSAFNVASFITTALPAVILLFWIHYPAQQLFEVNLPGFYSASIALTIINSLSIFRILSDAKNEFPTQYLLAAKVAGLSDRDTFFRIFAPIVVRMALPRWIDQQVFILHCTLLASFISVDETFRVAQRINSSVYQPILIYTAVAILFIVIGGAALQLSRYLRSRYTRDWSER